MTPGRYLRDHAVGLALLLGADIAVCGAIWAIGGWELAVFLGSILLLAAAGGAAADWLRRRAFYRRMEQSLEQLDRKYLLSEMLTPPGFAEGDALCDTLTAVCKSMNDHVAAVRRDEQEYREYIEGWVHEIKTPIAAMHLQCDNSRSPLARGMARELTRVEGLVEQVLYYARSFEVERDYILRPCRLKELADDALRQNARPLIEAGFSVQQGDLSARVPADPKWMRFILSQIIRNSIQYCGEAPVLRFEGREMPERVILTVADNGAGIPPEDIGRIFDKGFTGENGRRFPRSTGIGLYLCRRLCRRMGLGITAESHPGEGTRLHIIFPVGSLDAPAGNSYVGKPEP